MHASSNVSTYEGHAAQTLS